MIIYQSQPNKCFPPISFFLSEALPKPSFEFDAQLLALDKSQCFSFQTMDHHFKPVWLDYEGMIQNARPYNAKMPRQVDNKKIHFLYGIFDETRIDKREGDFAFTVISHPVDRLYDVFYFAKATLAKKTLCPNKIGEIVKSINPRFEFPKTLEVFIDTFIAGQGVLTFDKYELSPNIYRQQKSFEMFNFVGLVEKMGQTLGRLGHYLNVDFPMNDDLYESQTNIDKTYRRDEVEKIMKDDIEKYEEIVYYF
ncbi:hypothetical protein K1X76_12835 [bacterium]|nr:hypothetical protein [bacterium]